MPMPLGVVGVNSLSPACVVDRGSPILCGQKQCTCRRTVIPVISKTFCAAFGASIEVVSREHLVPMVDPGVCAPA